MFVFDRTAEHDAAKRCKRARNVVIAEISAFQKLGIHVLVSIVNLQRIRWCKPVCTPGVDAAAFSPDGISDDLAIICVAAQIMRIKVFNSRDPNIGYIGVNSFHTKISAVKLRQLGDVQPRPKGGFSRK